MTRRVRRKDLKGFLGLVALGAISNAFVNWIPWWLLGGLVLLSIIVYYLDKNGFFSNIPTPSSSRDLAVEVVDAPGRINRKVAKKPMWRKLNIDKSDREQLDTYVDTKEVRVDGSKNLMFGIVGRPRNQFTSEVIAYIYDLHEDRIRKFSGSVKNPEGRIQPFEGKYSWLTAQGVKSKSEARKNPSGIHISQQVQDSQESPVEDQG